MDEFVNELKKIQEEAEAALHKAHDDMKRFADRMRWSTRKGTRCGLAPKILILIDHRGN